MRRRPDQAAVGECPARTKQKGALVQCSEVGRAAAVFCEASTYFSIVSGKLTACSARASNSRLTLSALVLAGRREAAVLVLRSWLRMQNVFGECCE